MRLHAAAVLFAAIICLGSQALAAESPCARSFRVVFDRSGQAAAAPLDDAAIERIQTLVAAHPDRCAPGDYSLFINRYADLLTILGQAGLTDPERKLAALVRVIGPRRVATSGYDAAFHAFLDARARLTAHAAPEVTAELVTLLDAARPQEILPAAALGRDRDGMMQGLTEIRRQLAVGRVADADAKAEELLRALQAESAALVLDGGAPSGPPDGGAPAPGRADGGG